MIERGGGLAVLGEAGIGKSALLADVSERADRLVLAATGAESEAELPYAELLTLLRPVIAHARTLPDVQRWALEGGLGAGPPAPADLLAVHAAALGVLIAASQQEPLLLLVDDAHWLDP